jgi:hypothetical protein
MPLPQTAWLPRPNSRDTVQKQNFIFLFVAAGSIIAYGCADPNVDPPQPRPNTGYIDLYSPTDAELCWNVSERHGAGTHFRTVFSDVKPIEGDVLRLAFAPGQHRFRITFLNRVIKQPVDVSCDVRRGEVTPVGISLIAAGQTTVLSKRTTFGGTPAGLGGRRTKINSDETVIYEISAVVGATVPYQPKSRMPYTN